MDHISSSENDFSDFITVQGAELIENNKSSNSETYDPERSDNYISIINNKNIIYKQLKNDVDSISNECKLQINDCINRNSEDMAKVQERILSEKERKDLKEKELVIEEMKVKLSNLEGVICEKNKNLDISYECIKKMKTNQNKSLKEQNMHLQSSEDEKKQLKDKLTGEAVHLNEIILTRNKELAKIKEEKLKLIKNSDESLKNIELNIHELQNKKDKGEMILENQTKIADKVILNQRVAQAELFDMRKHRDTARKEYNEIQKNLLIANQELSEKSKEIYNVKCELEVIKNTKEKLKDQCMTLENEKNHEMKVFNERKQTMTQHYNDEYNKCSTNLEELKNKYHKFIADNINNDDNKKLTTEDNGEFVNTVLKKTGDNSHMKIENNEISQYFTLSKENKILSEKVIEYEKLMNKYKNECNTKKDRKLITNFKNGEVRDVNNIPTSELEEHRMYLFSELEDLQIDISNLNNDKSDLEREISNLKHTSLELRNNKNNNRENLSSGDNMKLMPLYNEYLDTGLQINSKLMCSLEESYHVLYLTTHNLNKDDISDCSNQKITEIKSISHNKETVLHLKKSLKEQRDQISDLIKDTSRFNHNLKENTMQKVLDRMVSIQEVGHRRLKETRSLKELIPIYHSKQEIMQNIDYQNEIDIYKAERIKSIEVYEEKRNKYLDMEKELFSKMASMEKQFKIKENSFNNEIEILKNQVLLYSKNKTETDIKENTMNDQFNSLNNLYYHLKQNSDKIMKSENQLYEQNQQLTNKVINLSEGINLSDKKMMELHASLESSTITITNLQNSISKFDQTEKSLNEEIQSLRKQVLEYSEYNTKSEKTEAARISEILCLQEELSRVNDIKAINKDLIKKMKHKYKSACDYIITLENNFQDYMLKRKMQCENNIASNMESEMSSLSEFEDMSQYDYTETSLIKTTCSDQEDIDEEDNSLNIEDLVENLNVRLNGLLDENIYLKKVMKKGNLNSGFSKVASSKEKYISTSGKSTNTVCKHQSLTYLDDSESTQSTVKCKYIKKKHAPSTKVIEDIECCKNVCVECAKQKKTTNIRRKSKMSKNSNKITN